jgi:rhamnose utilization protein RhaD (predicted bifunctional aldolase and dehydrogenase)/NAD(P)-dependent dehydrogenase (short-subunit alcohol dehydrogenase family)
MENETDPGPQTLHPARSLWRDEEAGEWARSVADPLLGLRVYTSRLLGRNPSLVLHGGGNTSVKSAAQDLLGNRIEVLHVKGSGSDLAKVDTSGFTPLDLSPLRGLMELERLTDEDMVRELRRFRLDPDAPTPSVETLLHAYLPFRFIDHTHADAVLALIQTPGGERRAREVWGDDYLIVPYVKPGFDLARAVKLLWDEAAAAGRSPIGLILLNHGAFTFADDARASYERMIDCVAAAERALPRRSAAPGHRPAPPWTPAEIARLRAAVSRLAGRPPRPMLLRLDDGAETRRFACHPGLPELALRGTLTPDHVIRTKRVPLVVDGPDGVEAALAAYAADYRRYFEDHAAGRPLTMLDPAPRVIVARGFGVFTAGATEADAQAALDVYRHTMAAVLLAEELGGYRPLPAADLFEIEYWDLEQAKLRRRPKPAALAGRVAVVTGAASGIGKACAAALRAQGAAVAGLDLAPVAPVPEADGSLGLVCDVTDPEALRAALTETVRRFGGIDIVVSNVGVFHAGASIEELDDAAWRRVMDLNAGSHLSLLRETAPFLKLAPAGGSVVVIGSKNVAAPGPGAAAYSASKAALTQLARVAALELAPHGIRVNVLHPDAVFDTAAWTPEVLAQRAARYGLTVEQYKRRNLLGAEITAADVGALAAALCTDLFARTTGAQIPVDGGNDRVI